MGEKLNISGVADLGVFEEKLRENLKRVKEDPEYLASITEEREGNPITLGPRVVDPESWAADMVTAAKNKAQKWLDRSLKPRKDPKERALKAAGKYDSNMRTALDQKRWDEGITGYDEGLRMETIKKTGTGGFSSGIERKADKIKARVRKLQPLVSALTATLDGMPVDTDDQREAKMIAAKRGMQALKGAMRK